MTLEELKNLETELRGKAAHLETFLKIGEKRAEKAAAEARMAAADFWDNKEKAQATVAQLSACRGVIEPYERLTKKLDDLTVGLELAAEDPDFAAELETVAEELRKGIADLEIYSFLAGPFDRKNFYFSIHAGAGGTESCDWAQMLLRMYRRYFERCGWKEELIDHQPGEEAGIKSVTMKVEGPYAYGYMKGEKGVHRLVRISPFDSNARRHTSFVSVDVFPEIDDDIDVEIDENDLRIDTYRSSGAGGQHINKTSSAIRITHFPTGIVVTCQNERSQFQNKDKAMQMLKAKLYMLKQQENAEKLSDIRGDVKDINFGNQIRSYVMQPYTLVKDHRTNAENGNIQAVMDGDIDYFISEYLKWTSLKSGR